MLKKNWTGVNEGTLFDKLKAGGYVLEITDVEDVSSRSYINLVYDIAEGPNAGHFDDSWGRDNPWAHRFVRSYKPNCEGMFKAFLQRLQDSNPGFDIAVWERNCDESDFIGLKIGAVLQYEDYTNQYGEDKERLVVTNISWSITSATANTRCPSASTSARPVPSTTRRWPAVSGSTASPSRRPAPTTICRSRHAAGDCRGHPATGR